MVQPPGHWVPQKYAPLRSLGECWSTRGHLFWRGGPRCRSCVAKMPPLLVPCVVFASEQGAIEDQWRPSHVDGTETDSACLLCHWIPIRK